MRASEIYNNEEFQQENKIAGGFKWVCKAKDYRRNDDE
jgi:hypothetical protein